MQSGAMADRNRRHDQAVHDVFLTTLGLLADLNVEDIAQFVIIIVAVLGSVIGSVFKKVKDSQEKRRRADEGHRHEPTRGPETQGDLSPQPIPMEPDLERPERHREVSPRRPREHRRLTRREPAEPVMTEGEAPPAAQRRRIPVARAQAVPPPPKPPSAEPLARPVVSNESHGPITEIAKVAQTLAAETRPTPASVITAANIRELLRGGSRSAVRRVVAVSEVLAPPLALREP